MVLSPGRVGGGQASNIPTRESKAGGYTSIKRFCACPGLAMRLEMGSCDGVFSICKGVVVQAWQRQSIQPNEGDVKRKAVGLGKAKEEKEGRE